MKVLDRMSTPEEDLARTDLMLTDIKRTVGCMSSVTSTIDQKLQNLEKDLEKKLGWMVAFAVVWLTFVMFFVFFSLLKVVGTLQLTTGS